MTNIFLKFLNGPSGSLKSKVKTNCHGGQIERIKTKLVIAQKIDKELKVFGAESHQYQIKPPVPEREVIAFEERFSLVLPECYRSFLTLLGNGGQSYCGSAAGPFYGIYEVPCQ